MTHASVFSGIGGPEVAAAMLGWKNAFHCEINPFGRAVLDYWFPEAESYEDITKTDFSKWGGQIDVLTGGFPCQPFSCAGQRRGADDDRYLWPFMFKCIDQIRPTWVIGENVGGILSMVEQGQVVAVEDAPTLFDEDGAVHRYEYRSTFTLERICRDLETHGYNVQPILVPACAVGAPHKRDRVFIIGHRSDANTELLRLQHNLERGSKEDLLGAQSQRREDGIPSEVQCPSSVGKRRTFANADGNRGSEVDEHMESEVTDGAVAFGNGWKWNAPSPRWDYDTNGGWLPTQSPVHRGNDGFSIRMDNLTISLPKWRNESIKAYGNAIVPQVMYEIFRAIEEVERCSSRACSEALSEGNPQKGCMDS